MLALARELRAHGHHAAIAAPPNFQDWVTSLGFEFHAVGTDVQRWLTEEGRRLTRFPAVLTVIGRIIDREVEDQFSRLPRAAEGADLIVGAGIQLAGPSVAERLGIPYRYVAYCPQILASRHHPPAFMPGARALPQLLNRLLWWAFLGAYERLLRPVVNRARVRLGLPGIERFFEYVFRDDLLVASDPALWPLPPDAPAAVRQTGALVLEEQGELPQELEDFLAAGPPPVYIGFGSMPDPEPQRTMDAVREALQAVGCRALISRGWANLGQGAGALPPGCLSIGPVPHARLFPRVAAVVHHGGAGTTSAAARAGVPQVIVPHAADQFGWGAWIHAAGLGPPPLRKPRLNARRLTAALRDVLERPERRERARQLQPQLQPARALRETREWLEAAVVSLSPRAPSAPLAGPASPSSTTGT
jgi:UDP:flavonoid glycosyltransferase YjiC (YdhE family)